MNKLPSDAIARVTELPDERQEAAATLLFEFLDGADEDFELTPEQIVEIERRLDEDEIASDEEVKVFFDRTKV